MIGLLIKIGGNGYENQSFYLGGSDDPRQHSEPNPRPNTTPLESDLKAGSYPVGFKVLWKRDYSRTWQHSDHSWEIPVQVARKGQGNRQ